MPFTSTSLIILSSNLHITSDWRDYSCDAAFTSILLKYRIGINLIIKNSMWFLAGLDSHLTEVWKYISVISLASSPWILRKTLALAALWPCFFFSCYLSPFKCLQTLGLFVIIIFTHLTLLDFQQVSFPVLETWFTFADQSLCFLQNFWLYLISHLWWLATHSELQLLCKSFVPCF